MTADTRSVRTMFLGSPQYASVILQKLIDHNQNINAVITQPDKRVGRGKNVESPPVKKTAEHAQIPCWQPRSLKDKEFIQLLHDLDPQLIIVAAYGKILKEDVLDYPEFGCLNVHASLLPRWRGASPIQAAILHGNRESGATIMEMDEGIDTGGIITSRKIDIKNNETSATLTEALAILGGELLVDVLPGYIRGEVRPVPQNHQFATYAGMIKKEDGLIDFHQPAAHLERMVRAYDPWPNAFFEWNGGMVKVFKARVLDSDSLDIAQRGTIDGYPCIGTNTNDLMLLELQLAGKKRVDGKVFLNGARDW